MATHEELTLAKTKLSATNLKNGMPGREEQFTKLYNFLSERLKNRENNKRPGNISKIIKTHLNKTILVCGVPGTGKTATVAAVLHKLQVDRLSDPDSLTEFEEVHINGQQIPNADHLFSIILLQLTGESLPPAKAQLKLDSWFKHNQNIDYINSDDDYVKSKKRRQPARKSRSKYEEISDTYKIIVIDELDLLFDQKSQSIFYTLFDWPTTSKVIIIGIANAMDLAHRFSKGMIESRIGWEIVIFNSYSTNDLKAIIVSRLGEELMFKCFEPAAIKIITSRIGKMTGDARRTLETCRNAIGIALDENQTKVTAQLADKVGFQNLENIRERFISKCPPIALILLQSIIQAINQFGEENVDIDNIINYTNFAISHLKIKGENPLNILKTMIKPVMIHDVFENLEHLAAADIIGFDTNKPKQSSKVYLKDTTDDFKTYIMAQNIIDLSQ